MTPTRERAGVRTPVGSAVVKPVDGFAGLDVWLVRDDDAAWSLLESATRAAPVT